MCFFYSEQLYHSRASVVKLYNVVERRFSAAGNIAMHLLKTESNLALGM